MSEHSTKLPGDHLFTGAPIEPTCLRQVVSDAVATPMDDRHTSQLGTPKEREVTDDGLGERLVFACGKTGCGACVTVYSEPDGTRTDQPQYALSPGQIKNLGNDCIVARAPRQPEPKSSFR